MRELSGDQTLEFGNQLVSTFRRQIELEEFDRNEALAGRVIGTKNGS
jgi:hypothetical protein